VCDGPATNSTVGGTVVYPTCGEANDFNSSHTLLNEPADIAVDPDDDPVTAQPGDVYIADGYGNHRVVVFDSHGNYLRQFGTKCTSTPCPDGTFGATGGGHPHCVVLGKDGLVYACDRPNSRIEVWDKMGNFVKSIHIGNAPSASAGAQAAILKENTRACDFDFYPNIDYLASKSPKSQKYIINVDLANDNVWIVDRKLGNIIGALGVCGIAPCPGHNAGHFSFSHTTASDSQGNVYVADTITGRRIQKFVPK
jgi:DNA-binding beta-propeller fold protein YncE